MVRRPAAETAGAPVPQVPQVLRLPTLTLSVALEESEKALKYCLRLEQWQHRSRLLLARMLASRDGRTALARDQLLQLVRPEKKSKGVPTLFCNLFQYTGAVPDDAAHGRPLRAYELVEDASQAVQLYAEVLSASIKDPSSAAAASSSRVAEAAKTMAEASRDLDLLRALVNLAKEVDGRGGTSAARQAALRAYAAGLVRRLALPPLAPSRPLP